MNFTRRDYKKCGENIEQRYSEKYIHAAMKSGFTNNDATYKQTYIRQNKVYTFLTYYPRFTKLFLA